MHKLLIGGMAVAALTATAAHAGDLPRPRPCRGPCPPLYPPPPPPPPPAPVPFLEYWCGPYIGANVGYQSGDLSNSGGASPSGVFAGVQGGYTWQFGQWVAGWEADFQFSSADDKFGINRFSNPWFGTVRGRGGIAFDNLLLYGTAGLAYGRGQIDAGHLSEVNTHLGWTIGAGVEYGLSRNWSIKAEYLRVELSSEPYVLTGFTHGLSSDVFRIGVNYRF